MTVMHIVLFDLTGVSEEITQKAVDSFHSLADPSSGIDGILELSAGKNFTQRGKQFTHALVIKFKDTASLEAYADHPAHQSVVSFIKPHLKDIVAFDYVV